MKVYELGVHILLSIECTFPCKTVTLTPATESPFFFFFRFVYSRCIYGALVWKIWKAINLLVFADVWGGWERFHFLKLMQRCVWSFLQKALLRAQNWLPSVEIHTVLQIYSRNLIHNLHISLVLFSKPSIKQSSHRLTDGVTHAEAGVSLLDALQTTHTSISCVVQLWNLLH